MKPERETHVLANLVSLVLCGVLAGVVIAAAAFPAVGPGALAAKSASDSFRKLPAEVRVVPPPQKSNLLTSKGQLIASFFDENRQNVTLDQIAPVMQDAIIAAEDTRFYEHQGVDVVGVARAFVANQQEGEITQGASTLTQQYVRQVLLYSAKTEEQRKAATEDTAVRKLREARFALALEDRLTKKQILENYLNIAFFGNGGYGIYAASSAYFSKLPKDLTLPEAAMLAGMVKNPTEFNPVDPDNGTQKAVDRRSYVLKQMVTTRKITEAEAEEARDVPLAGAQCQTANPPAGCLKPRPAKGSCENGDVSYGFYCRWFLDWWKANPAFGKSPGEREDELKRGGYRIVSAADPAIQQAANAQLKKELPANSKYATGIAVVQPGTGRVLAMASSRPFGLTKPATTNPILSGIKDQPGFQAGSTFKMFTMLAAFEQGMTLNTRYYAPYQYKTRYIGGSCGEYYCPHNASQNMTGAHRMWSGFGQSVNTYFIQLQEDVTVKAAVAAAERAGIVLRAEQDLENKAAAQKWDTSWGSFTLGVALVSPLHVANSFATVAARGIYCDPLPLVSLRGTDGKELDVSEPTCKRVFAPEVADAATDAARCPVGDNPGRPCQVGGGNITAASVGREFDRPIAGKTGTTNENMAGWFTGYTPNLAASAFIANPDKPSDSVPQDWTRKPIEVFKATMKAGLANLPAKQFVPPTSQYVNGQGATVPSVAGMLVDDATRQLKRAGFRVRVVADRVNSGYSAGRVAYTDPGGGESAAKGSTVRIFVSNGEQPRTDTPPPDDGAGPPGGGPPPRGDRPRRPPGPPPGGGGPIIPPVPF